MNAPPMAELSRSLLDGIKKSGATDPIEFYRRPLVGLLFRERINMGLRLLGDRHFERALEIGYGAGAVLLALSSQVEHLHGIDLDADPRRAEETLREKGSRAELRQGNVLSLPYEAASFDLVVSFSVFEHIREYRQGLAEVARVLKPTGQLLLGMPAVNKAMEWAFSAIGFRGIEHHHVTTPAEVERSLPALGFRERDSRRLGLRLPGLSLYYVWLLERR